MATYVTLNDLYSAIFVLFVTVTENMPQVRKRKASTSLDDGDPSSSNVLVIKRNRLTVKSQVQYSVQSLCHAYNSRDTKHWFEKAIRGQSNLTKGRIIAAKPKRKQFS